MQTVARGEFQPFGEQLRVDEHVDLAALVGGERLGQAHRRRPARDRLRLDPGRSELRREVVRVLDAGRVDDARRVVEALAVEARGGHVQGLVVEGLGQDVLVEVAADDRHRVDGRHRRHAQVAERRDQPAARGVLQRQVVDRGGEDVGDLLRDQLLGRGHPDVERLREGADRGRGLLPERGVRLVADHELVRVTVDRVDVPGEPGVGLDRERRLPRAAAVARDHVGQARAVALGREVARELGDEQAAVREDQDAERAGRLDEARGGDRLARGGRMAEAVAADGAGVVGHRLLGKLRVLDLDDEGRILVLVLDLLLLELLRGCRVAVAVPVGGFVVPLARGDQLGEHPGERVDLVAAERGAGGGARLRLGQHALEAEQEAVADLPFRRRRGQAGVHLGDRVVERAAAGRALGERHGRVLAVAKERLARPRFRAEC